MTRQGEAAVFKMCFGRFCMKPGRCGGQAAAFAYNTPNCITYFVEKEAVMAQIKIIKSNEVEPQGIRGLPEEAGQIRRVVSSEKLFFNIDEVAPGYSPHHWHRHDGYTVGGFKVEYPADLGNLLYSQRERRRAVEDRERQGRRTEGRAR